MRKRLLILCMLVFSFVLVACSNNTGKEEGNASNAASDGDTITIKVGTISPPEHSYTKGIELFAEKVEEKSDGRVQFDMFLDGQLGGEREIIEQVQLGSIDLTVATGGVVGSFVPELSVLEMPFLFDNVEQAYKVLDGEIGDQLVEKIDAQGFKTFGIWENGMRHLVNNKKTIKSPEDTKGMKMRTMENDLYLETYRSLGTDPTPIAFPETYTSLEQGVVDGQDLSLGVMVTTKMYEVQDYFTDSGIYYAAAPMFMNQEKFDSLPEDIQQIFIEVGEEVTHEQRQINQEMEAEQLEYLEEQGVEIYIPTEDEMKAFKDAVDPVYDKLSDQFNGMVEEIQEEIK